jgi:hypothetical protein
MLLFGVFSVSALSCHGASLCSVICLRLEFSQRVGGGNGLQHRSSTPPPETFCWGTRGVKAYRQSIIHTCSGVFIIGFHRPFGFLLLDE